MRTVCRSEKERDSAIHEKEGGDEVGGEDEEEDVEEEGDESMGKGEEERNSPPMAAIVFKMNECLATMSCETSFTNTRIRRFRRILSMSSLLPSASNSAIW